jgi:hypothetical protein
MSFPHTELFKVWVWFPDGTHMAETDWVDAETAVTKAASLSQNVGARVGTTEKITIVDLGDYTVFEWRYGEGVVYPPPQDESPRVSEELR